MDKIGDAVALPDGTFLVMERDDATGAEARKRVYHIDINPATDFLGYDLPAGVELQSDAGLANLGIRGSGNNSTWTWPIGYDAVDKPEGLALIDEQTLAVLNDNDSDRRRVRPGDGSDQENPNPTPVILGLVHLGGNGLDASDKDGYVTSCRGRWPGCTCPTASLRTPWTALPTW